MDKKAPVELTALQFNGRERRKYPRVRYDTGTYLEDSGGLLEVRLIDISLGGCSFSSASWQPEVGERRDLKFILPDCTSLLRVTVEICSRLGITSGVKFIQMDGASSDLLIQALHSKERASAPPGFFSS